MDLESRKRLTSDATVAARVFPHSRGGGCARHSAAAILLTDAAASSGPGASNSSPSGNVPSHRCAATHGRTTHNEVGARHRQWRPAREEEGWGAGVVGDETEDGSTRGERESGSRCVRERERRRVVRRRRRRRRGSGSGRAICACASARSFCRLQPQTLVLGDRRAHVSARTYANCRAEAGRFYSSCAEFRFFFFFFDIFIL